MKQKEYIGPGSVAALKPVLEEYSAKNIFLVTDKDSFGPCGAEKQLETLLQGYTVLQFCDFAPAPHNIDGLHKGIELFNKSQNDAVIAVGGGSVIDMAKMINVFAFNQLDPTQYVIENNPDAAKGAPLIAIPTTSGSGSQATHFAVLFVDGTKYSIAHDFILPDVAIVDPVLTMSAPPRLSAVTGMDALGQAIESYWCISSNEPSKEYAAEAIRLVMPNLALAVNSPTESSRLAMAKAAHLAGKAINITKTTAAHAISYALTSHFGISHGHAVALTLPWMLVYNSQLDEKSCLDSRGCGYVCRTIDEIVQLLGAANPCQAKEIIEKLMDDIGLQRRLQSLGIESQAQVEEIVVDGFNPQRGENNPRLLPKDTLREIVASMY